LFRWRFFLLLGEKREMTDFHVFYCRQRTGDCIDSYEPAPIEASRVPDLAGRVLEENGDFFGLVDDDDSVLQFIYLERTMDDQQPIRMEIPDMRRKKSLIRHISNAELFELLRNLPDRLTTDSVTLPCSKAVGS
jgi:hypothetical protein